MSYSETYDYIRDSVSQRALLELLAEEAAELSQAAIKLIRITYDDSYPVNKDKYNRILCERNLVEEMTDVSMCAYLLGIPLIDYDIEDAKFKDMIKRIKQNKKYQVGEINE